MRNDHALRLAGILFTALFLAGCSTMAESGTVRIEKDLALEPGGRFVLEADGGSVSLAGTSSSGARVKVYSNRDDLEEIFRFRFQESGDEVRVEAERIKKGFLGLFGTVKGVKLRFEMEVPRETDISLDTSGGSIRIDGIQGEVVLDTSGGSIRAEDVEGSLHADTSGGSISVQRIRGDANLDTSGGSITAISVDGEVVADTSGGAILIEEVSGAIDADTSGGPIDIREAGGYVRADTSGGGIEVVFAAGNAEGGILSTSGGGVTVRIDPAVGLDLEASTSGGRVRTDLPVTVRGTVGKSELRGTINGGGASLKVGSSGGGIRIEAR